MLYTLLPELRCYLDSFGQHSSIKREVNQYHFLVSEEKTGLTGPSCKAPGQLKPAKTEEKTVLAFFLACFTKIPADLALRRWGQPKCLLLSHKAAEFVYFQLHGTMLTKTPPACTCTAVFVHSMQMLFSMSHAMGCRVLSHLIITLMYM